MLVRGYVVFGAASTLAAFAPDVPTLITARALLGLGSAMIMPSTLSTIRQVFDDADARAKALGVWSAVASAGAVIGPLLGGALVERTWWGAVFLINVPVMLAAIPLTLSLVPESPRKVAGRWDATGAFLATAGVLGLAYGIKEAGHSGPLAPSTVLSLVAAATLPRPDGAKVLGAARETFVAGLHLTLTVSTGLLLAAGLVVVFVFRGRNRITSIQEDRDDQL